MKYEMTLCFNAIPIPKVRLSMFKGKKKLHTKMMKVPENSKIEIPKQWFKGLPVGKYYFQCRLDLDKEHYISDVNFVDIV